MPNPERRVVILGSTGSIGVQTIDVIECLNQSGYAFSMVGLAAGRNIDRLTDQIARHSPAVVCVAEVSGAELLRRRFPRLRVLVGDSGLEELAQLPEADLIVNALVGAVGLPPTLAALSLGRTVALANKESLVIGGELVAQLLRERGGAILPIDSEHNALFQCLRAGKGSEVRRVILTASGGPFLHTPEKNLSRVQAQEALRHPNWSMGRRITIDSATMVNKGFEVIEAHYLFSLPYERITVVVHPGSVIHGFVEYHDGSVLAQLASPDMRIPIQYALTCPERVDTDLSRLALEGISTMAFEPLDPERFPSFATVLEAARKGRTAPAAINAADEVLVERFLAADISFTGIGRGLDAVLSRWMAEYGDSNSVGQAGLNLDALLSVDRWARGVASKLCF